MSVASVGILALTGCSGSGKSLKFGETATVTGDRAGTVGVTVIRIDQGSDADLSALKDASKYTGKTPYYLHFKLTKTAEGNDDDETSRFDVSDGKRQLTELLVLPSLDAIGDPSVVTRRFERCEGASHTAYKEAAEGQSVNGCAIYLADKETGAPSTVKWTRRADTLATWK
ncbi:hypothetical protein [Streptomyces roseoverticillatus]|uniref:hypothetical protein n=1 Tax=Streptomyces roseoverticillatus TaxID=66429 RepID=UPI0012FF447F|nr:hypothetical protein [Streptomyces roseoverticillatus]